MSKIKSVSQFEDGIWGTETPIGADASNVDVEMSDSSTKDLQTVLGDIPSAAAPIQSQINTKVTASGGNIGNTTVSSGIQNFDSSSSETSTELLDTSVRVTNATEVTSSMWTKFNRFRKRVDNKFKDVFLSSVEDVASPSDYRTYSQSALNDYFANVVGYASASDLPDATSTIAQQLSTLNNKTIESTITDAGAFNGFTTIGALNWLYNHSNVTSTSQTVTWTFGSLYFSRRGPVVSVGHWPTSITTSGLYDYSYANIIPAAYRPVEDIRVFADDWAHGSNYALVQLLTDGTMKVRTQATNSDVQLHFSATYITDSTM